jgi:hypothetical protein
VGKVEYFWLISDGLIWVWLLWFCVGLESENPEKADLVSSERIFRIGLHNHHMYMWLGKMEFQLG